MDNAARVHHSNGLYSCILQTAHKPKLLSPKHSTVICSVCSLGPKAFCWVLVPHPAQLVPVPRDGSQMLLQCLQVLNLIVADRKEVMKENIKAGINWGLGRVFTMYVQR